MSELFPVFSCTSLTGWNSGLVDSYSSLTVRWADKSLSAGRETTSGCWTTSGRAISGSGFFRRKFGLPVYVNGGPRCWSVSPRASAGARGAPVRKPKHQRAVGDLHYVQNWNPFYFRSSNQNGDGNMIIIGDTSNCDCKLTSNLSQVAKLRCLRKSCTLIRRLYKMLPKQIWYRFNNGNTTKQLKTLPPTRWWPKLRRKLMTNVILASIHQNFFSHIHWP